MNNFIEKTTRINRTDIHYYRSGNGVKPPLVLLHGYTDDALCWQKVAEDLKDDFDLLIPDARGHGQSGSIDSGFTIPLMVDDTVQLIRDEEIEKTMVWGHSMGAAVTAQLAVQEPDMIRAIILEDPPLMETSDEMTQEDIKTRQESSKEHVKEFIAMQTDPYEDVVGRVSGQYPDWDIDEVKWWVDAKLRFDFNDLPKGGALASFVWRDVFSKINCPVLLFYADQDRGGLVTEGQIQEVKDLCNQIEAVYIKNAGHCIHRDRYEETMKVVSNFLARNR